MIKITYDEDNVHITGHTLPDICASVSSTVFMAANTFINLQSTGIDDGICNIIDNVADDYMHFNIDKHSKITDIIMQTMLSCLNDIAEDSNGCVIIEKNH